LSTNAAAKQVRILLADNDRLFREGVGRILQEDPDLEVVGEAETGAGLLELAGRHRPDIVLLDVQVGASGGLELLDRLHLAHGTVRNYLSGLYHKLGVRTRTQAVARARGLGLL